MDDGQHDSRQFSWSGEVTGNDDRCESDDGEEQVWGPKRFLIYYFVCGLGAMIVHERVIAFQYRHIMSIISPEQLQNVLDNGYQYVMQNPLERQLQSILITPTVGASGAIFGVLLAFGVLFPNTQLMLLFPPIPIRAKYFVMIYGGIEYAFNPKNKPKDVVSLSQFIKDMKLRKWGDVEIRHL